MSKIEKAKYKQKFYSKKHRNRQLDVNLKGFLCSCNNREKDCVREAYNLLNKYADLLYPPQPDNDEIKEDNDITDDLEKELNELRSEKCEKRFQVVESGAKNIIFIKTTLEDPVQLAQKIVTDIAETKSKQTKILLRLVPIEVTCKAYVKDIETAFKGISTKYFQGEPKTFSIIYNHRNNDKLKREEVIVAVANAVFEMKLDHKVNLKNPEISIVIEVIRTIASIGIVPDYVKYKKFNLHAIAEEEKNGDKLETEEDGQVKQAESNDT